MVGKALYEGILLNLSFAPFFIRCLQVSPTTSLGFFKTAFVAVVNTAATSTAIQLRSMLPCVLI